HGAHVGATGREAVAYRRCGRGTLHREQPEVLVRGLLSRPHQVRVEVGEHVVDGVGRCRGWHGSPERDDGRLLVRRIPRSHGPSLWSLPRLLASSRDDRGPYPVGHEEFSSGSRHSKSGGGHYVDLDGGFWKHRPLSRSAMAPTLRPVLLATWQAACCGET